MLVKVKCFLATVRQPGPRSTRVFPPLFTSVSDDDLLENTERLMVVMVSSAQSCAEGDL